MHKVNERVDEIVSQFHHLFMTPAERGELTVEPDIDDVKHAIRELLIIQDDKRAHRTMALENAVSSIESYPVSYTHLTLPTICSV